MGVATLNPVLSQINGRIGDVVFYRRQDKQCIRTYVVPNNPDTIAQRIIRENFAEAVKSWQSLTKDEKYRFIRKARNMNMSGYNLYISQYMKLTLICEHQTLVKEFLTKIPGIQRHIHSVSKSFTNIINEMMDVNALKESPG